MTKQEILDYFQDINHYYNDYTRYNSLLKMLDELIEEIDGKQIPKKPINQRLASGIIGDNGIMQGECPCCGEYVIGNYYGEYCGCCGQALDWDE